MLRLKVLENPVKDIPERVWQIASYPTSGIYEAATSHGVDWVLIVSTRIKMVALFQKSHLEDALYIEDFETSKEVSTVNSTQMGLSINDVLRLIAIKSDSANIEDILEK